MWGLGNFTVTVRGTDAFSGASKEIANFKLVLSPPIEVVATHYKSNWRSMWIRDVCLLFVSGPSTFGARGPNKTRLESRFCNKEV